MKNDLTHVVVLNGYHRKNCLRIPKFFAYGARIENKKFVVLKTKQGKSWLVDIHENISGRIVTSVGWCDFYDDNKLALNDTCLFKFVPGSGNVIEVEITPAK